MVGVFCILLIDLGFTPVWFTGPGFGGEKSWLDNLDYELLVGWLWLVLVLVMA